MVYIKKRERKKVREKKEKVGANVKKKCQDKQPRSKVQRKERCCAATGT
jgi:hypothetical protein